jgi:hypothetical protein
MILIVFTVHDLGTDKKHLDFIQLDHPQDFLGWLSGLGSQIVLNLTKKNRVFTAAGWEKTSIPVPNLIQVISDNEKVLFKVDSVRSDKGILFEDVKHCSEQFVDLVAANWVIQPADNI